ncbi:hypothetical protein AB0E74_19850 [Streptomyces sp. NPDC030392]|uniref:hypothetical protein n=1 Tax=Streptomyces sp. NPDC030392 TaxID=3155468 RepID=UPI0033D75876
MNRPYAHLTRRDGHPERGPHTHGRPAARRAHPAPRPYGGRAQGPCPYARPVPRPHTADTTATTSSTEEHQP